MVAHSALERIMWTSLVKLSRNPQNSQQSGRIANQKDLIILQIHSILTMLVLHHIRLKKLWIDLFRIQPSQDKSMQPGQDSAVSGKRPLRIQELNEIRKSDINH